MATDSLGAVTPLDRKDSPGRPASGALRSWPQRELAAFLLIPILVLAAVAVATVVVSERIARATALAEAERTAIRVSQVLVAPVLADALDGVPGRWQELERILATRMSDGSITTVVVWSADGEILFASDRDLVGRRVAPSDELLAAVGGSTVADVDENPETAYEGAGDGPMVEVYVPLAARGEPLAVETYFSYDAIEREAALLRGQIIPMAIGALVLLQVVQIPIALSLARRVRRHESERAELMELTLTASERERRAIAADVHDGPVQDLAGISYALGALRSSVPPDRQDTVDRLIGAMRHAVQSLRRLITDIYPPDLGGPGLAVAIEDLVGPLRARAVVVSLDMDPPPELSPEAAAAIYRTAKEALVNVAKHAEAQNVWVCLEQIQHERGPAARLEIADDGVGFPETGTDRRREGHVGLPVLVDRITDLGGTVELGKRLSGGAVVTAVIPLHDAR
jgi:signal transduction histidine kinase